MSGATQHKWPIDIGETSTVSYLSKNYLAN